MVQRFSQFSPQETPSARSAQTAVKANTEGKMHHSPASRDISASTHQNQHSRQLVYGIEEVSVMFDSLKEFLSLKEFDQELQKELSTVYPDYKMVLNNRQADLKRKDHGIVVAGESSSGKSTLINRIIGEKILSTKTLESTAAICRVKNAGTRKVEVFSYRKELCQSFLFAEDEKEIFKKKIERYTYKKNLTKEEIMSISAVDICVPLPLLKENTVIVDTPGIGGSKELAEKMMCYLPNAVAFVFVINASNAGGMQDDRINVILKQIGQHYKDGKMPCFDPRDVIFVINKWDCVQKEIHGDESDEENDHADVEITWQEILEKINSVWQTVKSDNIFKTSFISKKPEYQTEIKRFETQLSKIIDKNRTSRLKRHFMFLQEFMKEAGRGIRARLALLNKDDDTNSESIQKYTQSIHNIKQNIKDSNKSLEGEIKVVIDKLSQDFHEFITSDAGKTAILNPRNKKPIIEVSFLRLEDKVKERFQIFYKRWLTGEEVKKALSTLEEMIKKRCGHIRKSIEKVESEMTQTQSSSDEDLENLESSDVPFYVGVFASSPIWIPLLVAAGALCVVAAIVTSPLIIKAVTKYSSKEAKTKDINREYQACVKSLSKEIINNDLQKGYGNHYRALVSRLLDDTLTTKVSGLEFTVQQLSGQRDQIKEKQNVYRQLDEKLKKIK